KPGIARSRLDDGAARAEPAVALGRLDHGTRWPVLDRTRRVGALELEEEPARPTLDARHLHEWRVADEVEDRDHVTLPSIPPTPGSPPRAVPWWRDGRCPARRPGARRRCRRRSPATAAAA